MGQVAMHFNPVAASFGRELRAFLRWLDVGVKVLIIQAAVGVQIVMIAHAELGMKVKMQLMVT